MNKSTRIFKRLLALFLVVLMSINTLGAVVSDNDGSAFITKSEFEALKGNFSEQIINYNESIDSKIDGAIAYYLNGINLTKKEILQNLYNIYNPTWMKNKRFNHSHKGTRAIGFISFTEGDFQGNWLDYCFEGTATGWYLNKRIIKNETNQEVLYRIQNKDMGQIKNQWALQDIIDADYSITVGGGAAGGRGNGIEDYNRLLYPDYTLIEKPTNQKYFGTWYVGLPIAVWEVDRTTQVRLNKRNYISGSTGTGETLAVTSIATDLPHNEDNLFYLAGGEIQNDTMYCVNIASASEIGEPFLNVKTNAGGTRQVAWYTDNIWKSRTNWSNGYYDDVEVPNDYYGNIEAKVYRHIIYEMQSSDLLHESMTQNLNKKTYYYSGCPMFTATSNATVTFDIKFINSNNESTKFAFDNKPFENEENKGNAGSISECNITTFIVPHNTVLNVSFDVKKDETYWIKAEPQGSGYTTIEWTSDIVQTEE